MSKIVVGNLKMALTKYEVENYIDIIDKAKFNGLDVILCPSYLYLSWFEAKNYSLGAQNVFYESKGDYTGEISPMQLKDSNVKYVIIGHSDRRNLFNETDEMINKKIKAALNEGLKVILCIGENKEQSEMKRSSVILKKQLINALKDIDKCNYENIVVAYEPVYSIGTGNAMKTDEINGTVKFIKKVLKNNFNFECRVIYGGSVSKDNIKEITELCDGVMIGKSSYNAETFLNILKKIHI